MLRQGTRHAIHRLFRSVAILMVTEAGHSDPLLLAMSLRILGPPSRIVPMIKTRLLGPIVVLLLLAFVLLAQPPVRNINPRRHPNLAAAQDLCRQAFEKIVAAQQANEWDMNGHAQKAKELLDQAGNELRQAATAANRNAK